MTSFSVGSCSTFTGETCDTYNRLVTIKFQAWLVVAWHVRKNFIYTAHTGFNPCHPSDGVLEEVIVSAQMKALNVCSFEKSFRSKVMAWKSQYANDMEFTVGRFRAVSGPTKRSSYVKGNWWVECCFRG